MAEGDPTAKPLRIPDGSARSLKYDLWRACERVDPARIFGRGLDALTRDEQIELIAFATIRDEEDARRVQLVGFPKQG